MAVAAAPTLLMLVVFIYGIARPNSNININCCRVAYPMRSYLSVLNMRQMLSVSLLLSQLPLTFRFLSLCRRRSILLSMDDARHDELYSLSRIYFVQEKRMKMMLNASVLLKKEVFNFHISHFYHSLLRVCIAPRFFVCVSV